MDGSDPSEARVEAAEVSADQAQALAALPQVEVHKARSREQVRNVVSVSVVLVTLVIAVGVAAASVAGSSQADTMADLVLTPLVGLVGVILGFYFGGQDSTA